MGVKFSAELSFLCNEFQASRGAVGSDCGKPISTVVAGKVQFWLGSVTISTSVTFTITKGRKTLGRKVVSRFTTLSFDKVIIFE